MWVVGPNAIPDANRGKRTSNPLNPSIKTILHMDMDCFYAAIETRDNPALNGKPVIVGADPSGRGVVSACNYESRQYGIHSAMPIHKAKELCPKGIFLPVDMEKYESVSDQVMAVLERFTDRIEQISVDESFMDISDTGRLFGAPLEIGRKIKETISRELKLTASIGIAPNKFLSKLASEHGKPDGLFILSTEEMQDFLDKLPVGKLWGVGKETEKWLHRLGIKTVVQLRKYPDDILDDKLGATLARHLQALSRGRDDRVIETIRETLSMSRENTFQEDVSDRELLRKALLGQVDSICRRLRGHAMVCRTAVLIFRNTDFTKHTRRATLARPTDSTPEIFDAIRELFEKEDFYGKKVRLIGAGVAGLSEAGRGEEEQLDLFSRREKKKKDAGKVLDRIIDKFGDDAMTRASLLDK